LTAWPLEQPEEKVLPRPISPQELTVTELAPRPVVKVDVRVRVGQFDRTPDAAKVRYSACGRLLGE
jgi:hypothetical protein